MTPSSYLARYALIAIMGLIIGVAINVFLGKPFSGQVSPLISLLTLLLIYGVLHMAALSVASLLGLFLSAQIRALVYLALAIAGFLTSIFFLRFNMGLHLFIIFWATLVFIALDYGWRVKKKTLAS
jgi:hypothetical protein